MGVRRDWGSGFKIELGHSTGKFVNQGCNTNLTLVVWPFPGRTNESVVLLGFHSSDFSVPTPSQSFVHSSVSSERHS